MFRLTTVLFQTAFLLMATQVILGAFGSAVPGRTAWVGLPLLLLFIWMIRRTGSVMRQEMADARKRREPVVPWRLVAATVFIWQLPALVGLSIHQWLPGWLGSVWHGAMLPVVGTLDLLGLKVGGTGWWPFVATLLEIGLFAVVAGGQHLRPVVPTRLTGRPEVAARSEAAASGEWVAARRLKDVPKRARPTLDEENE